MANQCLQSMLIKFMRDPMCWRQYADPKNILDSQNIPSVSHHTTSPNHQFTSRTHTDSLPYPLETWSQLWRSLPWRQWWQLRSRRQDRRWRIRSSSIFRSAVNRLAVLCLVCLDPLFRKLPKILWAWLCIPKVLVSRPVGFIELSQASW